jgi:MFS family permease
MYSACEPAMTIVPNFLITGILALIIGLLVMIWSAGFIHHRYGGWIMIALSIALLLFGGGFFPPLIGMIARFTANAINKEFPGGQPGRFTMLMARLWPWPLVIFLTWVYGQLLVGHFFNDFMQQVMIYGVALILITLILSVISANAKDRIKAYRAEITTTSGESI